MWMTVMEDLSSPRPGTDDLFFIASKDQSRIVPPPVENEIDRRIPLPVDLIILFAVGMMFTARAMRRKRS
jgi:hypothetical protein